MPTQQAIDAKKFKEKVNAAKDEIVKLLKLEESGKITHAQFLKERLKHVGIFGTRAMYNNDGSTRKVQENL